MSPRRGERRRPAAAAACGRRAVGRRARAAGQPRAQPARPARAAAPLPRCAPRRRSSRCCSAPPPRSRRRCSPSSRSTRASNKHDTHDARAGRVAFLVSALLVWVMTYAQTYLVGWVGQRALADLRIRIFTHLQTPPIGFYESRPAGVLISRMTNDVEALDSLVTDSVVTLFQSGLTLIGTIGILLYLDVKLALLTFCVFPFVAAGSHLVPARLRRRLPAHARDDRRDHRLPAGDAVGHPRRAQLRPGARPRGALRGAQRGQPRRQHGHRAPQRRLLPGGGNALRGGARGDRPLRRLPGDRRAHHRRHDRRVRRRRCRSCSNRSSSSPSSTPPTSRAWRRWRRSSSCSTSRPTSRTRPTRSSCPHPRRGSLRGRLLRLQPALARAKRDGDAPPAQSRAASRTMPSWSRRAGAGGGARARPRRPATCPPARRSRSSAPPARASRRWPSSSPASTTRPRARARRRARPARGLEPLAALADGDRAAGGVPVLRHGRARTSPSGAPTPTTAQIRAAAARGRRRRVHLRARPRLRHRGRRARRAAVGRPAPADRLRARADRRPAHPRPRRGHLQRRPAHRGTHRGRACAACSPGAPRS